MSKKSDDIIREIVRIHGDNWERRAWRFYAQFLIERYNNAESIGTTRKQVVKEMAKFLDQIRFVRSLPLPPLPEHLFGPNPGKEIAMATETTDETTKSKGKERQPRARSRGTAKGTAKASKRKANGQKSSRTAKPRQD